MHGGTGRPHLTPSWAKRKIHRCSSFLGVMGVTSSVAERVDTRSMDPWRSPELVIDYGPEGTPSGAVCSMCGRRMLDDGSAPIADAKAAVAAFALAFQLHVRAKHPTFVRDYSVHSVIKVTGPTLKERGE